MSNRLAPPSAALNDWNDLFGPMDGPYVTSFDEEEGKWLVWWDEPTAPVARLDREEDALQEMRRLAGLWRATAGRKVYFIGTDSRVGAHVKIGIAFEPEKRLRSLQTASPRQLYILATMPGDKDEEQRLHRKFSRTRLEGEWFRVTPTLSRMIADLATACRSRRSQPGASPT